MRVQPHQLRVERHRLMRFTRTPERHAERLVRLIAALAVSLKHGPDPGAHLVHPFRHARHRLSQRQAPGHK